MSSIKCIHNRYKGQCRECGDKRFCEHGNHKPYCKECGGSQICQHGNRRSICKECGGSQICEHSIHKSICRVCGGSAYCGHNILKQSCKECGGSKYCKHDKRKTRCKECGGHELCKADGCETQSGQKYDGYCTRCAIYLRPDIQVCRNYKTREKHVTDYIQSQFSDFDWVNDKRVKEGCSRRRPDYLCDFGNQIIIVEVDENKHSSYEMSCENKRMMELSRDLGHRPIIFIRFNPDGYIGDHGRVPSPWKTGKDGIIRICEKGHLELNSRLEKLSETIQYWVSTVSEKTIEIVQLFYDKNESVKESS